jgi:hypothetical protein
MFFIEASKTLSLSGPNEVCFPETGRENYIVYCIYIQYYINYIRENFVGLNFKVAEIDLKREC